MEKSCMIQNNQERKIIEAQLRELEKRLEKAEKRQPDPNQKYSRASLKKMISRLHEELAELARSEENTQTIEPTAAVTREVTDT